MKKIISLLFFTFSLSYIVSNELSISTPSSSYSLLNKQSEFSIDYLNQDSVDKSSNIYKSNKMKKFGYAGIPLVSIGGTALIGGTIMFALFYIEYSLADVYTAQGGASNQQLNYLLAMLGASIAIIGELALIAGIVFMAVGFSLSKYYLKKENKKNKVTFTPYFDANKSYFKAGLTIYL